MNYLPTTFTMLTFACSSGEMQNLMISDTCSSDHISQDEVSREIGSSAEAEELLYSIDEYIDATSGTKPAYIKYNFLDIGTLKPDYKDLSASTGQCEPAWSGLATIDISGDHSITVDGGLHYYGGSDYQFVGKTNTSAPAEIADEVCGCDLIVEVHPAFGRVFTLCEFPYQDSCGAEGIDADERWAEFPLLEW